MCGFTKNIIKLWNSLYDVKNSHLNSNVLKSWSWISFADDNNNKKMSLG